MRARTGLIVFLDVFLVLIFVLASREDLRTPKLVIEPDYKDIDQGLDIIKEIEDNYFILSKELNWEKLTTDVELSKRWERPIFFECGVYCERQGIESTPDVTIVLYPPVSDLVANAYTIECFSNLEKCKGVTFNLDAQLKIRPHP